MIALLRWAAFGLFGLLSDLFRDEDSNPYDGCTSGPIDPCGGWGVMGGPVVVLDHEPSLHEERHGRCNPYQCVGIGGIRPKGEPGLDTPILDDPDDESRLTT